MATRTPTKSRPPPGFMPSRRNTKSVQDYDSIPELQEMLETTTKLIASRSASLRPTLEARKTELEERINYLAAMGSIGKRLDRTHVDVEAHAKREQDELAQQINSMNVVTPDDDRSEEPLELGPTVATKRKILAQSTPRFHPTNSKHSPQVLVFDHQEAIRLEESEARRQLARRQKAEAEQARREELLHRAESRSVSLRELTPQERNQRILAFMSYKGSDDEEDEDDDMDSGTDGEEDLEAMLQAEFEEDGTKGQDLIDPDELSHIIRVPDDIHRRGQASSSWNGYTDFHN
ncbi:hypothetical protein BOTBODRAFT_50616 [Botryobasidium botryosum FD-172 SS1]|uniref:Uncharacterized protein n=1 Tax=Botryobasidium botryosum (strain FD-172 SS1) TaxID=930990 RepID=A0A067N9Q9_BOTB1|nr:hypothetical protein BOTBODRAFT_50616 [Botryobasidium botryosum FD-172 SS1]